MSGSTHAPELLNLADRVRDQAELLRTVSIRITAAATATRWESPAAARFRDRIRSVALALRHGAGGLDEAADRITRQAARAAGADAAHGLGGGAR